MFKNRFLYFIILLNPFNLLAQKEDYNWILGYASAVKSKEDTGIYRLFGNTVVFFDESNSDTFRFLDGLDFNRTNASISDDNGDLLFYTNGIKVYNRMHFLMENGDSLNFSNLITDFDPTIFNGGYRWPQSAIIAKGQIDKNIYQILHSKLTLVQQGLDIYPTELLMSEIDLQYNNSIGKVIRKNQTIINDTISANLSL